MEPISLDFREPHAQTNTQSTCTEHLRGTRWVLLSDKRVEMKGSVFASGILRGLSAHREHKWFAAPSELAVCALSHLLVQSQFSEFIGEGFFPIYDTNCSELVQAKAAHPKLAHK